MSCLGGSAPAPIAGHPRAGVWGGRHLEHALAQQTTGARVGYFVESSTCDAQATVPAAAHSTQVALPAQQRPKPAKTPAQR